MAANPNVTVSVPKPCHENWKNMPPKENGRFCNTCERVVVDFTTMSNEQITQYFIANPANKTCGHFYTGQLATKQNSLHHFLLTIYCKAYNIQFTATRVAVLGLLSVVLTLAGCENTTGKIDARRQETTGDTTIMGAPIDSAKVPKDTVVPLKQTIKQ